MRILFLMLLTGLLLQSCVNGPPLNGRHSSSSPSKTNESESLILTLNEQTSTLNFLTVKAQHVIEVHSFETLSGTLKEGDLGSVSIRLDSVNTAIAIRDERMKSLLFEVVQFSTAKVSVDLSAINTSQLKPGQRALYNVQLDIDLHAMNKSVEAEVVVTRLKDGGLSIITNKPSVLNASDFSLVAGIEKLRELAGLPSIGYAVPITFALNFL